VKKKKPQSKKIVNRKARHDYELGDSLVVGISLSGSETKALRNGRGNLTGAYVTIKDGELWLVNSLINALPGTNLSESDQTRNRKLLAKRREIDHLAEANHQGKTIVPLELLTEGRYIKLRISIGKGKKHWDKRQTLKKRDQTRDIQRITDN
jgi:SsrA-binding protein